MAQGVSVVGVVTRIRHVDGRGHDTTPRLPGQRSALDQSILEST